MEPTLEHAYHLLMTETPKDALEYILARQDEIFQTENELQFFQGILSYYQGNIEQSAQQFLEIYHELIQNHRGILLWWDGIELIDSLLLAGQEQMAKNFILTHLQLTPGNPNLLNELGLIYYMQQDYPAAIATYAHILHAMPESISVLVNLGLAYSKNNQFPLALEVFEKAIELDDDKQSETELAVKEIIRNMFLRKGDCNSCNGVSACCRNMKLKFNDGHVCCEQDYRHVLAMDARNGNWVHTEDDSEGNWIFNCKYLGTDGKCRNYGVRPQICRDFPDIFYPTDKFPNCNYTFEPNPDFPKFNQDNTENTIKQSRFYPL